MKIEKADHWYLSISMWSAFLLALLYRFYELDKTKTYRSSSVHNVATVQHPCRHPLASAL